MPTAVGRGVLILTLIDELLAANATVTAHNPAAMDETRRKLGNSIRYVESNYDALEGADALVVVTDWNEYRHTDFAESKTPFEARSSSTAEICINPAKMKSLGFDYDSIGRRV